LDVLEAMKQDSNINIKELRVDGGAVVNNGLMQFQSDILRVLVIRPVITETTALGAAYLAGLATGYWKGISAIKNQWKVERQFKPSAKTTEVKKLVAGWRRAVKSAETWTE
ncbi:MAG TPA: FGGY-family carbohydrate kinase, partial [Bacteroidales bacterium]|nr:FGGY-family carbohydrate kinase [Bacteroidales bacterium]